MPSVAAASTTDVALPDPLGARPIPLRLFRSDAQRAGPLVVFSTGLGGEIGDFDYLGRLLAEHGYVVAVVVHPETATRYVCGNVPLDECWPKLLATELDPRVWDRRFADVKAVIDAVPAGLPAAVDATRIAVGGHSFGAYTALGFVGTTYVDPRINQRVNRRDPRVRAAFVMSPQGPDDVYGLDRASWDVVHAPVFLMTGDRDGVDKPLDSPEWRRESFARFPLGDKLMLRLKDGQHVSFIDRREHGYMRVALARLALAFLDAYLREDDGARAALASKQIEACSRGRATLERR